MTRGEPKPESEPVGQSIPLVSVHNPALAETKPVPGQKTLVGPLCGPGEALLHEAG